MARNIEIFQFAGSHGQRVAIDISAVNACEEISRHETLVLIGGERMRLACEFEYFVSRWKV